jgi:hypothetical protein
VAADPIGFAEDPPFAAEAKEVIGSLMFNFATAELFTIALIRLLIVPSRNRRDLIRGDIKRRIDAILLRLAKSELFSCDDRVELASALQGVQSVLFMRHAAAHDPLMEVNGQWCWVRVRDAEPDLTAVNSYNVDQMREANAYLVMVLRGIQRIVGPQMREALSSSRGIPKV